MRYDEGPPRPVPRGTRFPFQHPTLAELKDCCVRCGQKLTPRERAAASETCSVCRNTPKGAA